MTHVVKVALALAAGKLILVFDSNAAPSPDRFDGDGAYVDLGPVALGHRERFQDLLHDGRPELTDSLLRECALCVSMYGRGFSISGTVRAGDGDLGRPQGRLTGPLREALDRLGRAAAFGEYMGGSLRTPPEVRVDPRMLRAPSFLGRLTLRSGRLNAQNRLHPEQAAKDVVQYAQDLSLIHI